MVAAGGTFCSVQPFTGAVDPKGNPRSEGRKELRSGLTHRGKSSGQERARQHYGPWFHLIDNNNYCERCCLQPNAVLEEIET